MIYLDNAATTYPKPRSVIEKLNFCLKNSCGNPGRSGHKLSIMASEEIFSARESVANFLEHDKPEGVVFTYNATHAINLALKSYITDRCHVITSDIEHNSVIRPLEAMKKRIGIDYSIYQSDGNVYENIRRLIRPDTKCIISTLCSNVTGKTIDADILSRVARDHGLYLILDASQAIGHFQLSLKRTPCDVLAAPSHKALFGIQGSGFAVFRDCKRQESFIEGGSGSESMNPYMPELLPEGYEAGTPSTPSIATLNSGIAFVSSIGLSEIERKLNALTADTVEALKSVDGIEVYPSANGIVTFNSNKLSPSFVSAELDRRGICVREGLHCAPSAHLKIGTLNKGAVRVSFSYLNSKNDVLALKRALREILF